MFNFPFPHIEVANTNKKAMKLTIMAARIPNVSPIDPTIKPITAPPAIAVQRMPEIVP